MRMSMSTTSGLSRRARVTASVPLAAFACDFDAGLAFEDEPEAGPQSCWSSAMRTRTVIAPPSPGRGATPR